MRKYSTVLAVVLVALSIPGCRQSDSDSENTATETTLKPNSDGGSEIDVISADKTSKTGYTDQEVLEAVYSQNWDKKRVRTERRSGNSDIYSINSDGTELTWLAYSPAEERSPDISRDESKIAYVLDHGDNSEIYVMNADGTEKTNLTNNPAADKSPRISADGTKVLFSSLRSGSWEFYSVNADATGLMQLTNTGWDGLASFSPDGSKIVMLSRRDGNSEVYVMNADGSEQTNLTNSAEQENSPRFILDGSKIVFTRNGDERGKRYVMNVDGSGLTEVTLDMMLDNALQELEAAANEK